MSGSSDRIVSRRVVLFDADGMPMCFDVTVDIQGVAQEQAKRAMRNRSHISVVAGGKVRVEFIPS